MHQLDPSPIQNHPPWIQLVEAKELKEPCNQNASAFQVDPSSCVHIEPFHKQVQMIVELTNLGLIDEAQEQPKIGLPRDQFHEFGRAMALR